MKFSILMNEKFILFSKKLGVSIEFLTYKYKNMKNVSKLFWKKI